MTCETCGSTTGWVDGIKLERANESKREAMKAARQLRAALVGLIGADGEQDLRQMEATMRLLPAPAEDKAVSINAIHALLATMPFNAI